MIQQLLLNVVGTEDSSPQHCLARVFGPVNCKQVPHATQDRVQNRDVQFGSPLAFGKMTISTVGNLVADSVLPTLQISIPFNRLHDSVHEISKLPGIVVGDCFRHWYPSES